MTALDRRVITARQFKGISTLLSILMLGIITCPAMAVPPRSVITLEQGFAQVNEMLPWISGWDLDGRAQNVRQLLKTKSEEIRSVYLTLCHTRSEACVEQLRFLKSIQGVLESEGVDLLLIFAEDISANELSTWLAVRGFRPSSRLHILIDRFHRSALRLGAYQNIQTRQTLIQTNDARTEDHRSQKDDQASSQVLRVPIGLLVSTEGQVLLIVLQGGANLTDHISNALRYLDVESTFDLEESKR